MPERTSRLCRRAIQERHGEDQELLAALDEKETDLERRVAEVQEVLARYRRLATLGQLVDRILHDGRTPLAKLGNEAELGLREIDRTRGATPELVQNLKTRLAAIMRYKQTLDALLNRIEPFGGRQRAIQTTDAEERFEVGPGSSIQRHRFDFALSSLCEL